MAKQTTDKGLLCIPTQHFIPFLDLKSSTQLECLITLAIKTYTRKADFSKSEANAQGKGRHGLRRTKVTTIVSVSWHSLPDIRNSPPSHPQARKTEVWGRWWVDRKKAEAKKSGNKAKDEEKRDLERKKNEVLKMPSEAANR